MCSLKVSWSSKITPRFLTEVDGVGVILMCLIESRSHAVESEWQGRQEAQSLPG